MASEYVTRFRADTSQHDAAIKSSTGIMKSFDSSVKKTQTDLQKMSGKAKSALSGLANMGFDKLKGSLGGFGDFLVNNISGSLGKVSVAASGTSTGILGLSAAASTALPALAALGASIAVIKKSSEFEVNLDNLQSLTGLSDAAMTDIADSAIEMSTRFKSSAGDIVDSMGLIGSQFPALLEDSKALREVTEAANVLSIAAGINVTEAARGITTVLNQMGVAASEANNIINVLAAGSQAGAAEIDYLNQALEKSGTAFADANVSYVQAIAAIEAVAPKFSSADVAGSHLASTLLRLSTQGNNDFKPAVVGMSQALDNLAAAGLNDEEMMKLVGAQNITMLKTLIQSRDTFDELSVSLDGTTTAFDQMGIKMDNLPSLLSQLKNTWDGFILSMGQTSFFQTIMEGLKELVKGVTNTVRGITDVVKPLLNILGDLVFLPVKIVTAFIPFKAIGNAISFIWGGVTKILNGMATVVHEVTSVLLALFKKVSQGIGKLWSSMKSYLTNTSLFQWFKKQLGKLVEWWDKTISRIREAWKKFKKETDTEVLKFEPLETDEVEGKVEDIQLEEITIGNVALSEQAKDALIEGTIDWYEDALKKINDELQSTIVSETRLAELMALKAKYSEKLLQLQIKYGLATQKPESTVEEVNNPVDPNSYKGITDRLSELNSALDLEVYGSDKYWELVKSIKELTEKKLEIELQIDEDLLSDADKKLRDMKNSLELAEKIGSDVSSVISSLGNVFTEMGNKGDNANSKLYQTIGMVANAMAELIPHIITIITAKKAEAVASGSASAAKLPYPANIPAIFSIVGILGSLFAKLPKFANGGIIKGAASIGDYNIARVNSGEMILNGTQQAKLFNLLNTGGDLGNTGGENEVTFILEGEKLIGLMNNYNRKRGRIR